MNVIIFAQYGLQTWATPRKEEAKIETTYNAMMRSMLNVRLKDKIKKMREKIRIARNFVHGVRNCYLRSKRKRGGQNIIIIIIIIIIINYL